ncbi:citrulline utilization hydrolase CtlX [uncultured Maribacter sp.]|uniref:citrulline utilization hydrolase CtlX n=1 Tax=uncultured Maribacter sp. TaxID=431308 RepID=UPI0026029FD4|nr:arginine deiminase-related protein [uncultured Maribacter sp.]
MKQITNTILMVRPISFRMNEQTSINNYFQEKIDAEAVIVNKNAQKEFDDFVKVLKEKGVEVIVIEDTKIPDTPDSIFPNNWISFHADGTVGLYPMFAENRRNERREDILDALEKKGFIIENVMDYTSAEEDNIFLEGTGSLLLDRVNKKAYCALSDRAHEELIIEFCEDFDYLPVIFSSYQSVRDKRMLIYHTNVMMCLAEDFSVICLDSIDDKKERKNVIHHLKENGKEVISITEEQMHHFAGNMLQVLGGEGKRYLVMSSAAYNSLNKEQINSIEKYCEILHSSLETIETCGGGSARCMMAEVFLPQE